MEDNEVFVNLVKNDKGIPVLGITFEYNPKIVAAVRNIEGRKWKKKEKYWEIPRSSASSILGAFEGFDVIIGEGVDLDYIPSISLEDEIQVIKTERVRDFVRAFLKEVPKYFWSTGASSTGKYHPDYAAGEGGLVRHTKAAFWIAQDLFRCHTIQGFCQDAQDLISAALLLHDTYKHGLKGEKYTVAEHPAIAAKMVQEFNDKVTFLEPDELCFLYGCIKSHMGEWNTDYRTNEVILPVPGTPEQKFTHLCDYLASRKMLEVKFNEYSNIARSN